ncbi:MAG: rRNA maturation RNase YbeY [Akkermansiaceae bacterium]|jgi:rRNA maturation RNase YbeY
MVEVYPRCRSREVSEELLGLLVKGWSNVLDELQNLGVGQIKGIEALEVTLLDDDEMARVHGEFLNDPTPTDVITFDHGELLVGVETAARQALDYRTSQDGEIALYGIHGMLHLSGFDDRNPVDAREMKVRQEELFDRFFGGVFTE